MKERKGGPSRADDFMSDFLSEEKARLLIDETKNANLISAVKNRIYVLNTVELTELSQRILQDLAIKDEKEKHDQWEADLIVLRLLSKDRFSSRYSLSSRMEQYLQVLGQQNDKHHLYGVVENLFDAGVILFSGLALEKEDRENILAEMTRVAAYFSNEELTHEGLAEKITEFSETTTSVNLNTDGVLPDEPRPNPYLSSLERTVVPLPRSSKSRLRQAV